MRMRQCIKTFATAFAPAAIIFANPALGQGYTVPPALQATIDSHPHVRRLTDWGSRPDWSGDSKRLLFVSKEYGDIFELDVATGKTRPLSFHYPHAGIFRAYYLPNGDYLLLAPRTHTPGFEAYGRSNDSELWLLKGDLSGPPIALGEHNIEGIAVARGGMRVAWSRPKEPPEERVPDAQRRAPEPSSGESNSKLWAAEIVFVDGMPQLANKRVVLDCADKYSPLVKLVTQAGQRCAGFEPQNFVPSDDNRLTFTMATTGLQAGSPYSIGAYVIDLRNGKVMDLDRDEGYAEAEGVFPDGKSTLVEFAESAVLADAVHAVDLWQYQLDGSGRRRPVTWYHSLNASLKSNQGVVSPDGRWLAFGVSTSEIESKVAGQGLGVFLMDLKAAGF